MLGGGLTREKLIFLDEPLPSPLKESYRLAVGLAHTAGRKEHDGKPVMEDKLLVQGQVRGHSDADLIGVFDGHDGDVEADFAAREFTNIFAAELEKAETAALPHDPALLDLAPETELTPRRLQVCVALHESFRAMAGAMRAYQAEQGTFGGTTASVAYFDRDDLYVANVGDTRAVLGQNIAVGAHTVPQRLSVDHSLHLKAERERIESSGGLVVDASVPRVEGMLAVSRALGDFDLADKGVIWTPFIRVVPNFRSAGKFLVIASDGLWDHVEDDEAMILVDEELMFDPRFPPPGGSRFDSDSDEDMFGMDMGAEIDLPEKQNDSTREPELIEFSLDSGETEASKSLLQEAFHVGKSTDNISCIVVAWQTE